MTELEWARDRVRRMLAAGGEHRLVLVAVASADFAAAVEGRSRRLSSDADRALMFAWREVADVLLVGPRTLEAERYGSLLPPELEQRRRERGAPTWPPIATVSRTGELDLDRILRARTPPELTVYGPVEPRGPVAWRPAENLEGAVADLRGRGARTLVCEGGPTIYAQLVRAGLATDFSLTLAPTLAGGGVPLFDPAMRGRPHALRTLDVSAIGGHVFVHYAL